MSLLDVQQLTVQAPGTDVVPIVDALSFTLERGSSLAIVGESGSGKTQVVLALLGLQDPELRVSGHAVFDGTELIGASSTQLGSIRGARIGMVFQDPGLSLNPYLSIGVQIGEALEVHRGLSRAAALREAQRLLDTVRVADATRRVHQYPHELSGGMRQRAMLAAALACRPELLIADEPTTALDVTVQQQLITLLHDLRRELSLTLLLITHDLGLVGELCEQSLVLYAGRVMEQGRSDAMLKTPTQPYTQALLRARPRLDANPGVPLYAIAGRLSRASLRADGCPFAPRCASAIAVCTQQRPPAERSATGLRYCHRSQAEMT